MTACAGILCVDHDREVAPYRTGSFETSLAAGTGVPERLLVQLEDDRGARAGRTRATVAGAAPRPSPRVCRPRYPRRAPGVQGRVACRFGAHFRVNPQRPGGCLDVALHVEKSTGRLPSSHCSAAPGRRRARRSAAAVRSRYPRGKSTGRLRTPHAFELAVDVRAQRIEQASQEGGPHDVEIARHRIEHLDRARIDGKRGFPRRARRSCR